MLVKVLKAFDYALDGPGLHRAEVGAELDLPESMVRGLSAEGFVKVETKAMAAPENKAITEAPENKAGAPAEPHTDQPATQPERTIAKGPGGRWFVMDGTERVSNGFDTEEEARAAL